MHLEQPQDRSNTQNSIRKKIKISQQCPVSDRFTKQQIVQLGMSIKKMQEYTKIVSVQIQHQQKSIATLPQSIRQNTPELKQRVINCVDKAKYNVTILRNIAQPYLNLLQLINEQEQQQNHGQCNMTDHYHKEDYSAEQLLSLFPIMVRDWSQQGSSQRKYMQQIIKYVKMYGQSIQNVLCVGVDMGRIMLELRHAFPQSVHLQGHQDNPIQYLCAEYFLGKHTSLSVNQIVIYPYIHNFCNHLTPEGPFKCLKIPDVVNPLTDGIPITYGRFPELYRSHNQQWSILITLLCSHSIKDILQHIKICYRILKVGSLWIDIFQPNFQNNLIPITLQQYIKILNQSQFTLLHQHKLQQEWYWQHNNLMNEYRQVYYRVMRKQK